ncbi:LacI family DNA-binding transcriptional regulator [Mucilaginibacter panaciglaebae]|uniref:LacI family DNA-binding transcriptional regulator n=1 Tax=Mucilaginibacter panaciglaebae TaxID=502331 RepID=A0ABP7WWZ2_9SPHI
MDLKKKRVTIYDIARALNLTASTVSRSLNNNSRINEETRKQVIAKAREMNYRANSLASNLRKGKSQTIGIVVPRINQSFFSNVIAGIESITNEKNYNLIICQSNESHEKEIKCVNTLINQHVDCIVISVSAEGDDYTHLQNVIDHHIRLIQFDRVVEEIESLKVVNNNEQASREAVEHLIKAGYKRIALLAGPQNLDIFRDRKAGYLKALRANKVPVADELILDADSNNEHDAELIRSLLTLPNPPDAVFASRDDFLALGVLEVANDLGIKVPEQLGICGYSNENFTRITTPSLTTIDQYGVDMGKTIAQTYFELDDKNDETAIEIKTTSIKPKLIARASSQRK